MRPNVPSTLFVLILALSALALAACGSGANDCSDGADNDGDGLVDQEDPACAAGGDFESPDPDVPECNDGADNDDDGLIDLEDPGCQTPEDDDERNNPVPACSNGVDDDGDGLIDFPNDPGCEISLDDVEEDDCPDGPDCPACSNGVDDDGDGDVDYPDDLGCNSAGDREEENVDPTICGPNVPLLDLPSDGVDTGTVLEDETNDLISAECGGNGPETAYRFTLDERSSVVISTDFEETTVDTVVYLRSDCREPDTEAGCNDDAGNTSSELVIGDLAAGEYFVIVDSQLGEMGEYKVSVETHLPHGAACDAMAPDCAPGFTCRLAGPDATDETCEPVLEGAICTEGGEFRERVEPQPGDLVISEYMADPSGDDNVNPRDWFEIKANAGVDLHGLELGRAEPDTGPGAVLQTLGAADADPCRPVQSGDHLAFVQSDVAADNGGITDVFEVITFDVVNSTDGLFLFHDGTTLDEVTWQSSTTGTAQSLDPSGSMFCPAQDPYGDGDLGTPGAANPSCP